MKFCEHCGDEISTKDGENRCSACEAIDEKSKSARTKANQAAKRRRRARESALESLGLVKVRGAMGGVYWE